MAKYFKKVKSYENLKEQYKVLLKKNHPDNGGEVAKMQEINVEYDALFKIWKDRHESETGETVTETAETTRSRFYTENGWTGSNYNSSLDVKDVSKIVKTYIKEKYPTWKFSVRISRYSGGCSLRVECLESPVKMYKTADDLRAEGTTEHIKTTSYDGEPLEFDSIKDEIQDIMRKLHANGFLSDSHTDEEFFAAYEKAVADSNFYAIKTEYFESVIKDVEAFVNSYNYHDCDGMTDYFDVNFWFHGVYFDECVQVDKTARIKEPKNEIKKAEPQQAEETTPETQPEQKETKVYKYGMRLRGFSIGCQPSGVVECLDDETGKYYDIITYDRPLTVEELKEYELDDLNEPETVNFSKAETTAPSFEDLARAFVTGKTVKTQKKTEPKEEPQKQEFTKNGKIGTLHTEKEIKGKKYIIDAADLAENSDTRYEVVIMDENGDFAKEYHTDDRAEARRVFFQYSEMWIPEKESYGYEESSDYFTQEEIETLENGGQVKKDGYRKGESITFFSTPYTLEGARLVYELSTAGHDAHYRGFIVNHKFYNDKEKISEEMKTDINTEVKRLLPTEQEAEKNAGEVSDHEKEQIDFYRNNDFLNDAQKHFYKGTEPELVLYHTYNSFTADECIKYLLNPTEYTETQAMEYIGSYNKIEILKRYMQYNRTAATLAKIRADKDSETQKMKCIMDSIDNEKSVKVTLVNGNTVKVDADAVKRIGYLGYINSWNVSACDRQYLRKNEYNREENIKAEDIKQITHGQKILYKVA